eukprot:2131261-Prymnesium_polylepis.1
MAEHSFTRMAGAVASRAKPAPTLSSTQELSTGPAVPSCSPHFLSRPPESASPAPHQLPEPCSLSAARPLTGVLSLGFAIPLPTA